MNRCQKVQEISRYIHRWIANQPHVKEESITDYLLYELSDKIPQILYHVFSRQTEAKKTGADWEWWILFANDCAYKLRIQAKKCFRDNYSHIAYKNKHGLQIKKLLKDAISTNSIPFYAFYTAEKLCYRNDEGVYLAGANNIYNSFIKPGRKKVLTRDILLKSNPLSCFFCWTISIDTDYFLGFYETETREEIQRALDIKDNKDTDAILGLHNSIPNYVSDLSEIDSVLYEEEYSKNLNGIDAIVVYDLRERSDVSKVNKCNLRCLLRQSVNCWSQCKTTRF